MLRWVLGLVLGLELGSELGSVHGSVLVWVQVWVLGWVLEWVNGWVPGFQKATPEDQLTRASLCHRLQIPMHRQWKRISVISVAASLTSSRRRTFAGQTRA